MRPLNRSAVINEGGPAISREPYKKRNDRNSNIASRRRFIFALHKDLLFIGYIRVSVTGGGVAGRQPDGLRIDLMANITHLLRATGMKTAPGRDI